MKFIRQYPIFSILLLAFILRITLFFISGQYGYSSFFLFDTYRYLNIGTHLFEDGLYAEKITEPIFESVYVTPGAPVLFYLLRSIGGLDAIILFQIFCQLLTCYFLMKTVKILYPEYEKFSALFCGLLFALDIPTIVLGNVIMTETVFTLLFFLFFYFFISFLVNHRAKNSLYASCFLGLSALFRPIILYFPIVIIIYFSLHFLITKKIQFKPLLYFFIPFYLLTGSWYFTNYKMHGHIFYSMVGEFNLLYFQAADIYAEVNGISVAEARTTLYHDVQNSFDASEYDQVDQYIFYARSGEMARKIILENPVPFLKNMARANINLFFRPVRDYLKITLGSNELFHTRSKDHSLFILISDYWQMILNVLLFILIIPGILFLYSKNPAAAFFMISVFLYFMLVCSGPEIDGRFRVPLVPVILINACAGVVFIGEKIKAKSIPS
jgi:hypothetical protein